MGKKRILKVIGLLFLLVLVAWSIRMIVFPPKRHPVLGPQVVQVIKAKQDNWQDKIEATGTLFANQGVVVSPEIDGMVTKILFKSGDYVKAGTLLLQLDPSIQQAALDSALSQIPLDESQYKRALDLYKKNVGSQQDLDTAKANLLQARANAAKAQAELELKSVEAPFSGQLGLRQVDLGDYLKAGTAIVSLEEVDKIRVEFTVPQRYVPQIKSGEKVEMTSDAHKGSTFFGTVYATDARLDTNTRSIGVWASVPNDGGHLTPGSFVNVTLYVGESKAVTVLPQQAIVYNDASDFVYVIVDKKAVKKNVNVTQTEGKWVSVTGIEPGDVVAVSGQNKLVDGIGVNPTLINSTALSMS